VTGAELAALFARLCFAGPLLYIGLVMATDPASFALGLANLADVLHSVAHRFDVGRKQRVTPDTALSHAGIRCTGILVVSAAFLIVWAPW
jgi:hypothetical protein